MRTRSALRLAFLAGALWSSGALAQITQKVVDIPTRPGVSQRVLALVPNRPKAAAILFAGGNGSVKLAPDGSLGAAKNNFLVRTREMFAAKDVLTIVVDAPSDRQEAPFLSGFRQTPEHVEDMRAVMSWARAQANVPVWLVGTSRGTQSAAHVAIESAGAAGPDGLVLTSTILTEKKGRPVTAMALDKLRIPVLIVHHEQDGCPLCAFSDIRSLTDKLVNSPRTQLITFTGGEDRGDPCEALAYHGYNGLEEKVVSQIIDWMLATNP